MSGLKEKTIKLILKRKIDNWLETVDDKALRELIQKDVFVTGGAIASMLLDEKVNDYDIYFRTKETTLAVAKHYVDRFNKEQGELAGVKNCNPQVREEKRKNIKGEEEDRIVIWMQSSGVASESQDPYHFFEGEPEITTDKFIETLMEDPIETLQHMANDIKPGDGRKAPRPRYRPVFFSQNAVTLSDGMQIVIRFFGEPEEIHKNYDFAHTTNYFTYSDCELVLNPEALVSLLTKSLVYRGSLYPLASIFRTRKFIGRGWRVTAGQMLKMVFQLNAVNLDDMAVLREQLIGVDMSYMMELLDALKKVDGKIDATYLAKLVDDVFE
jgi:hypothetical protein